MLFSSPAFFLFFACYFLLHIVLPRYHRLLLVVVGSTVFYAFWNVPYVIVPYSLVLIVYLGATWMELASTDESRKRRMICTVVGLLIPLVFFKYTNFIYNDVLGLAWEQSRKVIDLPLPLGISFVTFTLIAYTVDVYRHQFPLESRLKMLTGYVLFFPQLIAGPIVLPRQLILQLDRPKPALSARFRNGIAVFSVGLVKKLVFADQIAKVVNPVFAGGGDFSSLDYLLATYGFSLQIFCDFSGYSDMAIGLGLLLGVKLPKNFERPYCSASIVEFWRRWHMTLSNWLRDYLYIPLGGSRNGRFKQIRNVLITMVLGGLWHGASWTFVIWGLIHGLVIALTHLIRWQRLGGPLAATPRWIKIFVTFHLVTFTWIVFRAESVSDIGRIVAGIFQGPLPDLAAFASANVFPLTLLAVFFATHRYDNLTRIRAFVRKAPGELLWPIIIMLWVLAITISAGNSADFIYFDF